MFREPKVRLWGATGIVRLEHTMFLSFILAGVLLMFIISSNKRRVDVPFLALVVALFAFSGCVSDRMQTKSYNWRHLVYKGEKPKKDWFVPPKSAKSRKDFNLRYGTCARRELQPYLNNLKQLTRTCVEIRQKWSGLAMQNRGIYGALIAMGIVGGSAVLVSPIFTVVKVEAPFDVGLLITTIGASVTGLATLTLSIGNYGEMSNKGFKNLKAIETLVQKTEVRWQHEVCQVSSLPLATKNAKTLLLVLSETCVNDPPHVEKNPNIADAIKKQQKNIQDTIVSYSAIQQHAESQNELRESRQTLSRLVRRIEATQDKLSQSTGSKSKDGRSESLYTKLESLCAQARQEHLRYVSLYRHARGEKGAQRTFAKGGWFGLCQNAKAMRKRIQERGNMQELRESKNTLAQLVKRITTTQRKLLRKGASNPAKRSTLLATMKMQCSQASQEHKRYESLFNIVQGASKNRTLPKGSWYGICTNANDSLKKARNKLLQQTFDRSQKTLQSLVQKINANHSQFQASPVTQKSKPAEKIKGSSPSIGSGSTTLVRTKTQSYQKQKIISLCKQANQEFLRSNALQRQLNLNTGVAVPAGSWLAICQSYDATIGKTTRPKE